MTGVGEGTIGLGEDADGSGGVPRERQFAHLHLHTEFSLLDGGNRVDRLIARVKELGMEAVAITDHGNLFGCLTFYEQAKAAGVKPILGCEAYIAPGDRTDRTYTGVQDGGFHLVLLAENNTGWQNLMALASDAYLTGFYYKPRMDRALLEKHHEGLIAINGHLGSELAHHLVNYHRSGDEDHWRKAVECCEWHSRVFAPTPAGPRFFVELQHHIPEQNEINPLLIRLARELDLPVVCDNDAHFLKAEEHDHHDTLVCISTGKSKHDDSRMKYPREIYVKGPGEMRDLFEKQYAEPWLGLEGPTLLGREACDNTVRIAERCEVDLAFGNHAPIVEVCVPDDELVYAGEADRTAWFKRFCARYELRPYDAEGSARSADELKAACDRALRDLCEAGLIWRYGVEGQEASGGEGHDWKAIRARLERELGILRDKDISAYFLIVWDFVNWARQRGIPALARGSGVGTMVGYVLGLSNACPVHYGLLFERFTDPDRSEYPDIDIDLCQDGRSDVINYVREKYGHVAQIITFGTLGTKAVIKDVGRVFDMPHAQVNELTKLVPDQLKMTIDKALDQEPALREKYESDPLIKRILDTGRVLEGQARHTSVHAAGVIVATRPLHEVVPLYRPPGTEDVVTQWDGPTCERIGLLKMDFLGLRTLSVMERAKALIRETLPAEEIWRTLYRDKPGRMPDARARAETDPLDLDTFEFDDDRVFDLFRRGDTTGVFQFESGGMRRLLTEMKPDRLEDLIAANALFRPGPMDLIPDYNERKHGRQAVPTVHPIVDGFTAETYGIMVYQEQVMQIVHELGGIPLRAAYTLIKAISKKKETVINENRPTFIEGAHEKGLSRRDAEELFDLILKFAGYGFNKSHSTGYAIVAYQTALLKTYFPNQYMAAFLTFESQAQKTEDWIKYKDDCRRTVFADGSVGVEIRPPDVNLSDADFSVVYAPGEEQTSLNGHVRFGLRAIKGAGSKAIEAIVHERDGRGVYRSLYDFCERVPPGTVNKATIEALVCCGAFDSVHGVEERASMVATIDAAVSAGQSLARDRAAGQSGLFGGGDDGGVAAAADGPEPVLVRTRAWDQSELLQREKDALGFYVSAHPLDAWRDRIATFGNSTIDGVRDRKQDDFVIVGGLVKGVRPIQTRKGDRMAIVTIEDELHTLEAVLFPRTYSDEADKIVIDDVVFLAGKVDHSRGDPQVIVDRVVRAHEAEKYLAGSFTVCVDARGSSPADLDGLLRQLNGVLRSQQMGVGGDGVDVPLTIALETSRRRVVLRSRRVRVRPSRELIDLLGRVLGENAVEVGGGAELSRPEPRYRGKRSASAVA